MRHGIPCHLYWFACAVLLLLPAPHLRAQAAETPALIIELELGSAWQSRNDAEIPNDGSATRFSLRELAGSGPWRAGRMQVTWNPAARHGIRLLGAPFTLTETGVPATDVALQGETFGGGLPVRATYTFHSWRLGYRYLLRAGDRTSAWIGFTAKIRDAVIALEQGGTRARKTDLGFVPLLHLAGEWRPTDRWSLLLDADALAGGPGRAVDLTLQAGYRLDDHWRIRAGYRTIEGGADVTDVYTFAWLHQAVVAVDWRR